MIQSLPERPLPRVAVIVVAYHGDRWMPDCIDSLATATHTHCRILVVDNVGNTCLEKLSLGSHEHAILKCPRPMGFAEANNFAMVNGGLQDEFVCFLNQDTLSQEGWLDACIACLERDTGIGALTPLMATYDGQAWDPNFMTCALGARDLHERLLTKQELDPWYAAPVIPAAAMVARSRVIRQVGPFDPIYGSYYEDYDLCRRIRKAGCSVGICTTGKICHYSGSATVTPEAERRRRRLILRNRAIYQMRHEGVTRRSSLFRYIYHNFCWNFCRSLARTSSSQPLSDYLTAHWHLIPFARRLLSAMHDDACWQNYLEQIGWHSASGFDPTQCAVVKES